MDFDILQAANEDINVNAFFGTFAFVPVVDGDFITARPTELLANGQVNVVSRVLWSAYIIQSVNLGHLCRTKL